MRLRVRRRNYVRGQALVEFAIVAPLFFLLLFALINGARYVYTTNAYGQAAREGARWGSVEQWSYDCPVSVSPKTRKACTEAVTLMVPAGAPAPQTVLFTCATSSCRAGELLTMNVNGQFRFFTPIISNLIGTPTVSQTAQVVIQ